MRKKTIAALIHGQYLLEGRSDARPRLLVGFHGYGETAQGHMKRLRQIPGIEKWLVCSVQSLHLFYNAKTREVVGSWMTKQNRELMISDNIRYVAAVVAEVNRERGACHLLVFAGFSQGVAMAYRAAAYCGFGCDGLIALAGDVPPEIAADKRLRLPPVLLGRGKSDAFYTKEKFSGDCKILKAKAARLDTVVFEGGHEWSEEFRDRSGQFLKRLR